MIVNGKQRKATESNGKQRCLVGREDGEGHDEEEALERLEDRDDAHDQPPYPPGFLDGGSDDAALRRGCAFGASFRLWGRGSATAA